MFQPQKYIFFNIQTLFDNFFRKRKDICYCGRGIGGQTSTQMLARFTADGCHPNPDTYFIMEELVVKAIDEALGTK